MLFIFFSIFLLALINLMKSAITYEYCFYLNFLIIWIFISIQQVEQAIYQRRIFLYTYLKEESKILQFFKGGFILSSFQIIKSMMMSLMLAFVLIEFEPLMWLLVLIFGLIFYFLKNMIKNTLKVSVHEELSDQFAQSLTKWTIVLFHMAALIAIQLYQPVNDLSGLSFKSAYEQLHQENQFVLLPSIGVFLEYMAIGHHLSFWAIQNINNSDFLITEKILQSVILAYFCISSVFYTWFLLYFYAGLCVTLDYQGSFSRLKKLDRRYFGENQR